MPTIRQKDSTATIKVQSSIVVENHANCIVLKECKLLNGKVAFIGESIDSAQIDTNLDRVTLIRLGVIKDID